MSDTVVRGRVWVLLDDAGRLIEDIDTDQIFHNAHLHLIEPAQMGPHAFGNLEGWKDFPLKVRSGDLVAAGRNFGAGSSRQQAVDCFIALGVGAILAPSFSAIYFRNAVNTGFPVLRLPDLSRFAAEGRILSGDDLEADFAAGAVRNLSRGGDFAGEPMSAVQRDIREAGGLFAFGRSRR